MRNFFLSLLATACFSTGFAKQNLCDFPLSGYKLVEESIYPFILNQKKSCFFAYYIPNPAPTADNPGDTIWYGYYNAEEPTKIYEFPRPPDSDWSRVCSIDAVSFYDMNGDKIPDVTVIGSCDSNIINFAVPFVFIQQKGKFIFDKKTYLNLFGFPALTISDVRQYIKQPQIYYKILEDRYY